VPPQGRAVLEQRPLGSGVRAGGRHDVAQLRHLFEVVEALGPEGDGRLERRVHLRHRPRLPLRHGD